MRTPKTSQDALQKANHILRQSASPFMLLALHRILQLQVFVGNPKKLSKVLMFTGKAGAAIPHDESLVRPETCGVPLKEATSEMVFFNTFFCPYAQMAWIALNEKGAAPKTEFVEGLTIRGGDYEVHPRLKALGRSGVPTLYCPSTNTVVDGSTACVEFIDKEFGEAHQLLPSDPSMLKRARWCEELLHSRFTFNFYSMLLWQEEEKQEEAKRKIIDAIETIVKNYEGPFYLGEEFSVADIAMAPYFDRMVVLDHYRNFQVPSGGVMARWHEWSANVLNRPSVAATRQYRKRVIEAYLRYAKCYVRNNWYERVFYLGY